MGNFLPKIVFEDIQDDNIDEMNENHGSNENLRDL